MGPDLSRNTGPLLGYFDGPGSIYSGHSLHPNCQSMGQAIEVTRARRSELGDRRREEIEVALGPTCSDGEEAVELGEDEAEHDDGGDNAEGRSRDGRLGQLGLQVALELAVKVDALEGLQDAHGCGVRPDSMRLLSTPRSGSYSQRVQTCTDSLLKAPSLKTPKQQEPPLWRRHPQLPEHTR